MSRPKLFPTGHIVFIVIMLFVFLFFVMVLGKDGIGVGLFVVSLPLGFGALVNLNGQANKQREWDRLNDPRNSQQQSSPAAEAPSLYANRDR